jgi:hypothetical protein
MYLELIIMWMLAFTLGYFYSDKIKWGREHLQVKFLSKINFSTNVHLHHIIIPANLPKVVDRPKKAMEMIKSYMKNVYQQSLMYYQEEQRGSIVDKAQAHPAATLIYDSSHFIINTS